MIWESFLDKTVDSEVFKKNIISPQFARLERKAETRADETRVETENQQNIAANANIEAEKALTDTEKTHLRPKKPIIMLKKLIILLKQQRSYYWKSKRILKKL